MSGFTRCNYCTLALMRLNLPAGKKLTLLKGIDTGKRGLLATGITVYCHPENVHIEQLPKEEREHYFAVWFAELSDHCVC